MDVKITGLGVGDVPAVVALWNRAAPEDPVTARRFRDLVLLDVNFDPAGLRLAWTGGELGGAASAAGRGTPGVGAALERAPGWVPFFFVAPEARGSGVGRAVLTSA